MAWLGVALNGFWPNIPIGLVLLPLGLRLIVKSSQCPCPAESPVDNLYYAPDTPTRCSSALPGKQAETKRGTPAPLPSLFRNTGCSLRSLWVANPAIAARLGVFAKGGGRVERREPFLFSRCSGIKTAWVPHPRSFFG